MNYWGIGFTLVCYIGPFVAIYALRDELELELKQPLQDRHPEKGHKKTYITCIIAITGN